MRFRDRANNLALRGVLASVVMVIGAASAGPAFAVDYGSPAPSTAAAPASLQLGAGSSAALASFLVGPNGMTLYALSSDTSTGSICTGGCLTAWPPLLVAAGGSVTGPAGATGTFSTFMRADDGSTQVAYNGRPLYYFVHDTAAGQTNGEGIKAFGGTWHVALAAVAATSSPSATVAPTTAASVPPTSTDDSRTADGPGAVPTVLLLLLAAGAATLIGVGRLSRRARGA